MELRVLQYFSADPVKYNFLPLPYKDTWSVLMRKDSPLAEKDSITPEDDLTRKGNSYE